jgi:SWI/SNF-related matrix-associated actin-dependent regulator of chromatin subfamily A member 5
MKLRPPTPNTAIRHYVNIFTLSDGANDNGKSGGERMSEANEDTALIETTQSKRKVVRLDRQPTILAPHCEIHPYQPERLNWLIKLHGHEINGILTDEIDLPKTLQTFSLLTYLRKSRNAAKMLATKDERQHLTDTMIVPNPGSNKYKSKSDVLVTSHEETVNAKRQLEKVLWKYSVIDEAHRIKI